MLERFRAFLSSKAAFGGWGQHCGVPERAPALPSRPCRPRAAARGRGHHSQGAASPCPVLPGKAPGPTGTAQPRSSSGTRSASATRVCLRQGVSTPGVSANPVSVPRSWLRELGEQPEHPHNSIGLCPAEMYRLVCKAEKRLCWCQGQLRSLLPCPLAE